MILELDDANVFCYLALGPWYYIIKFWGAVPFTRHRVNGEYVYMAQKMVFSNMIGPAVLILSMFYGIIGMHYEVLENSSTTKRIMWYFYMTGPITATITMISCMLRQKEYLLTFERIRSADLELSKYGIRLSYRADYIKLFIAVSSCPCAGFLYEVMVSYTRQRTRYRQLLEILSFGPSIALRVYCLMNFYLIVGMLSRQFEHINRLCVRMGCYDKYFNDDNDMISREDVIPCKELRNIMFIYQKISSTVQIFNKAFQEILLVQVLSNVFGVVIIIYLSFRRDESVSMNEYILQSIIYSANLYAVLMKVESLYNEAAFTCRIISLHEGLYRNKELSNLKHNFLLQGVHMPPNMTVAGIFPLDSHIITDNLNDCTSFALFLITIQ